MKKAFLLVLVMLLFVGIVPLRVEAFGNEAWVVLIGSYGTVSNWHQFILDTYYAYVTLRQYYDIDPDINIKYLIFDPSWEIEYGMTDNETTKQNVRWTISDWLSDVADGDDVVFIYFGCHGGGAYQNGTLEGGRIDLDGDEGREHQYSNGTWFGVDECLWLTESGEQYWDDELAEDLDNITYEQLIVMFQACRSANATCFSGGFIDDLSAPNRIIIASSNETSPSYGDLDEDGFSEFSEGFFDALYGYDTWMEFGYIHTGEQVDADFNNDGEVSILEAWQYAYEHDDARWSVRTLNGTIEDPLGEFGEGVDESPWMDDDGDGLPTFKAGYDIFLLGDFNFDGRVDVTDLDMFLEAYNSEEYHPLYDLDGHGTIDGWDFLILWQCLEKRDLSISASSGGTTDPAPGTHTYILNSQASVTAIPNSDSGGYYYFTHWLLDGATVYSNPITVTMDSNHTLEAHFRWSTCPTLFVWNGTEYVYEALLDIHGDSDVTVRHEIQNVLALEDGVYKLQLRELDNYTSHIDQVRLYAVDDEGEWHSCLLTYAYHSELGKVKHTLRFDEDSRVDLKPMEVIDLEFAQPISYDKTAYFIFEINGFNKKWPGDNP